MSPTQAILLAGGRGRRLGGLTRTTPKPLLKVGGRPFLEYVILNLSRQGIRDIVLSVGFLADRVIEAMGDGSRLGVRIGYAVEDTPLGTGGGARMAAESLDRTRPFLVVNADTLFDFRIDRLEKAAADHGVGAAMALRRVPDCGRFGSVALESGLVRNFREKSAPGDPGLVNGGTYLLTAGVLEKLPAGSCSLEADLFPALAREGSLAGVVGDGFFLDIGLPETLAAAEKSVPEWFGKNTTMDK